MCGAVFRDTEEVRADGELGRVIPSQCIDILLLFYVCVLCTLYVNLCAIDAINKCNLLTYNVSTRSTPMAETYFVSCEQWSVIMFHISYTRAQEILSIRVFVVCLYERRSFI